jgi:hypothetical protein
VTRSNPKTTFFTEKTGIYRLSDSFIKYIYYYKVVIINIDDMGVDNMAGNQNPFLILPEDNVNKFSCYGNPMGTEGYKVEISPMGTIACDKYHKGYCSASVDTGSLTPKNWGEVWDHGWRSLLTGLLGGIDDECNTKAFDGVGKNIWKKYLGKRIEKTGNKCIALEGLERLKAHYTDNNPNVDLEKSIFDCP